MLKVLAVDDDLDILWMFREILKRGGFEVVEAQSGKESLQKIKEEKPDVVLLDVMMPGMNGWDVSRTIKSDEDTKSLPVVICTSKHGDEDKVISFRYGKAEWHVDRPFNHKILIDVLNLAASGTEDIEDKIAKVVEKEERRKEVLEMLNPKLLDHTYEF